MRGLLFQKKEGYFTVEATFVVTICVVVLMAVLYTALYVHDRIVTEAVTQRQTAYWIHQRKEEMADDEEFAARLREELERKLFLFSLPQVHVEDGLTTKCVRVSYTLPVSLSFLKRIWGGRDGVREESVHVTDIRPAKWKWDADAVRAGGGKGGTKDDQ